MRPGVTNCRCPRSSPSPSVCFISGPGISRPESHGTNGWSCSCHSTRALPRSASLRDATGAKPVAGQTVRVKVTGLAGSLVPNDAKTAYLNVTAVNTASDGFVTAYPCDAARPLASSLNPIAGLITANLVAAPIGSDGNVCLFTNVATDLVADLAGYHPAAAAYVPTQPQRLLETRTTEPGGQVGFSGAKPADGSTIWLETNKLPLR